MCANRRYFSFHYPHLQFLLRTKRVQNLSRSHLALKGCAVPDLLVCCSQHCGPHQSPSKRCLLQLKAQQHLLHLQVTLPSPQLCVAHVLC